MRIIVTGGGTGGHLFPGIAFATGMQQRVPGCRVMFIGTRRLLDRETLVDYDFELGSIRCMGLKGMGVAGRIKSLLQLPGALLEARKIIREFRPDVVFGVGGYVTGPVLLGAWLSGIPLCIHEQNSAPGLANKLASRLADRIFLSLPCQYPFPEGKTVMAGNPVRREIIEAAAKGKSAGNDKITILVLGGSQGAHRVNMLMVEAVEKLAGRYGQKAAVIHQTGVTDEEDVRARYARLGVEARVQGFFKDMAGLYREAGLVVSRAGATTLAELAVMGLPALLIPYPHAADDHQRTNGLYYEEGGAAKVLLEDELNGEKLAGRISDLLDNPKMLQTMAEKMKGMGKPDATDRIIDECLKLMKM